MRAKGKRMFLAIFFSTIFVLGNAGLLFMSQPSFGRLPTGARLERIRNSPNYRDGKFQNLTPTKMMPGAKETEAEKAARTGNRVPKEPLQMEVTDLKALPRDRDWLVWFGHSSYLMMLGGKTFLVDPVFYKGSPVSFVNKMFPGTDKYKAEDMPEIDYLVISHDHYDHLDYEAVTKLRKKVKRVICPLGVGEHFEYWKYKPEQLVELDWWEAAELESGFRLECTPARHFSGRTFNMNQSLWASYVLETPGRKLYLGGDSGYDSHFKQIAAKHPGIDLAILENGQYNTRWKDIHTMPEYLPKVMKEIGAKRVMTVHNSKFSLAPHDWDEPLKNARSAAKAAGVPLVEPGMGSVFYLD